MIFIVPVILGAAAACGLLGVYKGTEGFSKAQQAQAIGDTAHAKYQAAVASIEKDWEKVNQTANLYGKLQIRVSEKVISRLVDFIKRKGKKGSQSEFEFLVGLAGIPMEKVSTFEMALFEGGDLSKDFMGIASASLAAGSGTVGVANAIGTVAVPQFFGLFTKQVAVSQLGLSGAVAWLGGGSVALGTAVVGGVSLGPALALGGFKLAEKGEEALTQARKYEAEVNIAIEKIEFSRGTLLNLRRRIKEVGHLIYTLEKKALRCLDELETRSEKLEAQAKKTKARELEASMDVRKFQEVALLIAVMKEIFELPITDENGSLDPRIYALKKKYQG